MNHTAYIGIGSNLGDRETNIHRAIDLLKGHAQIEVAKISRIYNTKPLLDEGRGSQPDFLNGTLEIKTALDPEGLLDVLKETEESLGRPRLREKGMPRTIDLDILFYDDLILDALHLKIPHPELEKRMFVLRPLCDIAPWLVHPASGHSVQKLNDALTADS